MTLVMYGSPRGMKAVPAAKPEGVGSIIRAGLAVAGERPSVDGQGMPRTGLDSQGLGLVEDFMDEVMAEYRRRLALLGDSGDRRAVEDGIALLSDCRLSGMDSARFEKLLSMLRAGRSPAGLSVLKPERIGSELARRWEMYRAVRGAN